MSTSQRASVNGEKSIRRESSAFRRRVLEVAACLRRCTVTRPTRSSTPGEPRPKKKKEAGLTSALRSQYVINQNCKQLLLNTDYTVLSEYFPDTGTMVV